MTSVPHRFSDCTISLLHATRGRPRQAVAVREEWLAAAAKPDRVEHVFAMDCDDVDALPVLEKFPNCVVPQAGLGCVAAWNLAARKSTGDVLVQLSDDWSPSPRWDELIADRLRDASRPGVLRISDGHRTDDLLCMAIFTRAWLHELGDFLHPRYFSVFSDDEFSFVSYDRGVVIDARDIVFTHHHPFLDPTVTEDETYRRQNQSKHYQTGRAIFLEHFPDAPGRWLHEGTERRQFMPRGHRANIASLGVTGVTPMGKADADAGAWKKYAERCDSALRARKQHAMLFLTTAENVLEQLREAKRSLRGRLFWKAAHQARLARLESGLSAARQKVDSSAASPAIDDALQISRDGLRLMEEIRDGRPFSASIPAGIVGALKSEVKAQEKWRQQVASILAAIPGTDKPPASDVETVEGRIE